MFRNVRCNSIEFRFLGSSQRQFRGTLKFLYVRYDDPLDAHNWSYDSYQFVFSVSSRHLEYVLHIIHNLESGHLVEELRGSV